MNEKLERLETENAQLKSTNQLLIRILYLLRDVIANPGDKEATNNALNAITKIIGE